MKNIPFTISMLILSMVLASKMARAEGTVEVMCRNKAKEIAVQTYQNCVTEEKAARLQDLKSRYKARMSEVKSEFQRELDGINGKTAAESVKNKAAKVAATKKSRTAKAEAKIEPMLPKANRPEKPVAGIATTLPAKQNDNGPAEPIRAATEEQSVIASTPLEAATESESGGADTTPEPEITDAPAGE